MLGKEDNNTALLDKQNLLYQGGAAGQAGKQGKADTHQQYHINIADLGQYRIKSHCNYDPQTVGTTDYSVFQVEILDEKLQQFYRGTHLLEVWARNGERLFQKVLQEEIPESQWELFNNVVVFKTASDPHLIYIMFLNERKMTTVYHPYEDYKEVDIKYFENYLIVAQAFNLRFLHLTAADIATSLDSYQLDRNGSGMPAMPQTLNREFSGIVHGERIVGTVYNHIRHELLFICANDQFQLSYFKLQVNKGSNRQVTMSKYEAPADPKGAKRAKNLEKKQTSTVPSDIAQLHFVASEGSAFLLVLRKNQHLELVFNFNETLFVESRMNLDRILGSFGENITYQFHDGSIASSPSFDRLGERNYIQEADYYRSLLFPLAGSIQHEIHRGLHFYSDSVVVNQTLFLMRDNVIFQVNTANRKVVNTHYSEGGYSGSPVISLHKLRQQTEDEVGFKSTTVKVVAVHQNGMLQVFVPEDLNLMSRWSRSQITITAMSQTRDPCQYTFQNQNASNYLYIVTANASNNTQKIYQMMFNTQIIEFTNIKLARGDLVFSVNSQSRQRELLGIVDVKYLCIYRNDKGNLVKLYQINHTRFDFREHINLNSIFYFQREYALIVSSNFVFKINIATNAVDNIRLPGVVQQGGSAFIDASFFYFLSKAKKQSSLSITDSGMIEAAFLDAQKGEQSAIVDKDEKKGAKTELMHAQFGFGPAAIKRMDYDDFNSVLNLQMANFEIVQVPLYHRNTINFFGMAERSYYLAFKRHGDNLFALDKANFLSQWSTVTGELISRSECLSANYSNYQVDRDLYDRDWFSYTLIYSQSDEENRVNKVISIDKKGTIIERLTFVHPAPRNAAQHLYFNSKLDRMIELNIPKAGEAVYTEYQIDAVKKWQPLETSQIIPWHKKSLFPFSLNPHDFSSVNTERLRLKPTEDTFKFDKSGNKVKVLNTQDGIELVINARNGEVENFMALQYSFTNTKASFYDKRCGQFFIQEVTSRLQNFYEYIRRQIFLENKAKAEVMIKLQAVDVSAKDYKHKYVIERSYTEMDLQFFRQFLDTRGNKDKESKLLSIFKKLSGDLIQRMVHNVFPEDDNAETLLHHMAKFNHGFEVVDFIGKQAKKDGFVVPFLLNLRKQTPLDIAVARHDHKQTNSLIKLLQKAPMDHHSRLIAHLLPKLVGDMSIPQLDKYFDRRRFQTGVCKEITLLKLKISSEHEMRSVPTTLVNDNRFAVEFSLTAEKAAEQSVSLECFDLPLIENSLVPKHEQEAKTANDYEVRLVKSLAATDNLDIFQQKTVRAFIDFMWPKAKSQIIRNVVLPYIAFTLYFMVYLMVIKRLRVLQTEDPLFYDFASGMVRQYDLFFKSVLFLGCFYFLWEDFQQVKSLAKNPIVLWSYANIVPLMMMMFVVVWDILDSSETVGSPGGFQMTLYSLTAFLVWIRVVHLLKCFSHTSYLLRMANEILFKIRWLIAFVVISLLSFGFTFYFVDDSATEFRKPLDGIRQMFHLLIGNYDIEAFENNYQTVLLVIVTCFNAFFIFTLLVALSVTSFNKNGGVWSNEAYQDKASLIGLYSYQLEEKAVRDPKKDYLLIATVVDNRKRALKDQTSSQIAGGINTDPRIAQAKMMKNIDRRLNQLSTKVERALREIQEKVNGAGANDRH